MLLDRDPTTGADDALLGSVFAAMSEELVIQAQDGRIIDANPAAEQILGLSRDRPTAAVATFVDITNHLALSRELREARSALETILDAVPARITAWHPDYTNRFVNRTAARQFGIAAADALGKPGALGLLGLQERFAAVGGAVEVVGNQPCGTTIAIRLPVAVAG